ncbi:hypothetical protein [Moraxella sp. ZY200743]|uniref:hypothetical protein n=1 Tax=Moraxella sp. ZY200743 TaxID=2911970 RepID=UPI003D7E0D9F
MNKLTDFLTLPATFSPKKSTMIWGVLSFLTMSQAYAGDCYSDPDIDNGRVISGYAEVGNHNGVTIYGCFRDINLAALQRKINVSENVIIRGDSQAIGVGRTTKVADFSVSSVEVTGPDFPDTPLSQNHVFKEAKSLRDSLQEAFHFATFARNATLRDKSRNRDFLNECCQGLSRPNHGNYRGTMRDYLVQNAHRFTVNGQPASPVIPPQQIDFFTHKIATKQVEVGNGVSMTVDFVSRARNGFFYAKARGGEGWVYCLLTVGVQASVDLNTAKPGVHTLNIGYNSGN